MFSGAVQRADDDALDDITAMTITRNFQGRWVAFLVLRDGEATFVPTDTSEEPFEVPLEAGECVLLDSLYYDLADDRNILMLAAGSFDPITREEAESLLAHAVLHASEQEGDFIGVFRYMGPEEAAGIAGFA